MVARTTKRKDRSSNWSQERPSSNSILCLTNGGIYGIIYATIKLHSIASSEGLMLCVVNRDGYIVHVDASYSLCIRYMQTHGCHAPDYRLRLAVEDQSTVSGYRPATDRELAAWAGDDE